MRKINVVIILMLLIDMLAGDAIAQPFCQWTKGYGNTEDDFGVGVTVDKFGNSYTTGYFNSPAITFGATTLTNVDNSGYSSDIFIVKSDSCGNVVWAKKAGDQYYDDRGIAITTDKNGNVYATGSYYSYYIKFGSDSLANNGTGWSSYIVKYNAAGNVLWAKGMDANSTVLAMDIDVDKNGDIYLSGSYSSDSVLFGNVKVYGDPANDNSFLAKYDNNGNVQWVKTAQYGSNGISNTAIDSTDNIVVAGYFLDSVKVGSVLMKGQANRNAYFAKYNSSGTVLWAKSAGNNYDDEATGITTDKTGNIFITGYFKSDSISFGSTKLLLPNSSVVGNAFLAKYDGTGNALWAKRIGGLYQDYGEDVTTNAAGDVFVTGNFASSSISLGGFSLNNITTTDTTFDIFLAKYDTNGQVKWVKKAGGVRNDYVECIAMGPNGMPCITGEFKSGSVSFSQNTLVNNGLFDVFISNEMNRIGVPVPQLCEVTVDSLSQNNMIYWDKTPYTNVSRFIVYREVATNNYKPIASVHVDSLSMVVDTVRTKYFPNTGDPNIGTYRYKLQIVDTAGNYGLLSPFHNTIYIVDNGTGQFTWNPAYTIEGSANPVNNYVLLRNNNGTGTWVTVGSVTGNQNTIADPAYATYPNGRWRVESDWGISCSPTRGVINTTRSNIKGSAVATSISNNATGQLLVYPNPATQTIVVQYPVGAGDCQLRISNTLGQLIYTEKLTDSSTAAGTVTKQIDVSAFKKGIYFINVQGENGYAFERVVIQ